MAEQSAAGSIEAWDREKIAREDWTRLTISCVDRTAVRLLIAHFRPWFAACGQGRSMLSVNEHRLSATIAFADTADCVLFRLTFEVVATLVPQPLAH